MFAVDQQLNLQQLFLKFSTLQLSPILVKESLHPKAELVLYRVAYLEIYFL